MSITATTLATNVLACAFAFQGGVAWPHGLAIAHSVTTILREPPVPVHPHVPPIAALNSAASGRHDPVLPQVSSL